ncbi:hypothetical protein PIB30_037060 [Stylosanthes scabra]|uniref:Uncharacterized protein n=1 Tax=Stylosanthes scabra TaxID=79078 RepID=A0ABU6VEB4_9FABA|nr:hypothetical protein [Stylosanthes scabra]
MITQNHRFFFISLISLNSHTLFPFVSLNSTTHHRQLLCSFTLHTSPPPPPTFASSPPFSIFVLSLSSITGRRPTREMPPPLPCLIEYVEEELEKKVYSERLSQMYIIPPRYVGDGAIPEDRYPEF